MGNGVSVGWWSGCAGEADGILAGQPPGHVWRPCFPYAGLSQRRKLSSQGQTPRMTGTGSSAPGRCRAALNQTPRLAQQYLGDNPIMPVWAEVAAAALRELALGDFTRLAQSRARFVGVVQPILGQGQYRVSLSRLPPQIG